MRDSYLLLTPILVLGVIGLVRFVGCDIVFGVTAVDPAPPSFVVDQALGKIRNDFSGFAGMAVDIGSKSLKVRSLGRYCVAGSTGDHRVEIVDAQTGVPLPTAVVIISLLGRPEGYVSANLTAPLILNAGQRYYVVSEEVMGGDQFFDNDTVLTTLPDATVASPVYFDSDAQQWVLLGNPGSSYGPVNFAYDKPN